MKLSNTMIVNGSVMPSKKAFTLAEVLITLSILGVVAALTIPSLVNRQSEMAAIVKVKKAISQFEQVAEVYMAENEAQNITAMVTTGATSSKPCEGLKDYFKIVGGSGCTFTTADGVEWNFASDGTSVVVYDSATSPKFGVAMNAAGGVANPTDSNAVTAPATVKADVYTAANFLKISKPADVSGTTKLKAKASS